MPVVLWHIEVSHYNEKARWALDYKGIAHERRAPLPGLHVLYAAAMTRGAHRHLPVLELDGRRVGDSTAIVAALEDRWPEPPLYPRDPGLRARALELEEHFDEQVAPAVRRFVFHHALRDPAAFTDLVVPVAGAGRRRALRLLHPALARAIRREYGVGRDEPERLRRQILAGMDLLERELGPSGYLAGNRFSVADLTAAALLTPVLCPPERQYAPVVRMPAVLELREELESRPGGAWVAEMFARHRATSAATAG